MRYTLTTANYCQLGKRNNQEDSLFPKHPTSGDRLFMVCDGVGGSVGGELASNAVCKLLPLEMEKWTKADKSPNDSQVKAIMQRVTEKLEEEQIGSAATTMTLLYLNKKEALIVHTGDSRVYQFRSGKGLIMRTKDHSLVQTLVDEGLLTEEQARNHPRSNIITRAIRILEADETMPNPTIDRVRDIKKGDVFLLCSDGVWGEITDDKLYEILTAKTSLKDRCDKLAELTAESHDNNTAVIVEITEVKNFFGWF